MPRTIKSSAIEYDKRLNEFISGFFAKQIRKEREKEVDAINVSAQAQEWINFARQSRIVSGTEVVRFSPYPYQVELFKAFTTHTGVCVAKIRQCGITETFGNIFLWKASKSAAYTAVIFSQTGDATAKIAERVARMANGNPYCDIAKANQREVRLKDGGQILFRTSNPGSSRGLSSVHDILFDEWGFISPRGLDKTLWGDITPAQEMVGKAARIAVVSTPPERPGTQYMEILKSNNRQNDIYKITRKMREGKIEPVQCWTDANGWAKFFIHWRAHPIQSMREDHLEEVRTSKQLDEVRLQREHNLNFEVRSSASMVDVNAIPRYKWPEAIPANPWLVFQSWDTAQSDNPGSAKWAGGTYSLYNGNIYLIDVVMEKFTFPDGWRAVQRFGRNHKPHIILIENKSSGADIIATAKDEGFKYPMKAIEPGRGGKGSDDPKVRRFGREVHQIEAGKLYLPEYAPWLTDVENALKGFPEKEYRDFVDQLSQALAYVREVAEKPDEVEPEDGSLLGSFGEVYDSFF